MDGDIEEIEQFLNQIEEIEQFLNQIDVQSRSPLSRKTADELFKRLKALEHECENESDKDRLATVEAMLAGYQLSFWLPGGWRNIIMLVIVVFAVLGGFLVHWYWVFLLLWATSFSPRLVGKVAFFIGFLSAHYQEGREAR